MDPNRGVLSYAYVETWRVIEQLYNSEINVGLQADFDGGIVVWIGGPVGTPGNRILSQRTFASSEFDDVAPWLDVEARHLFPASTYARNPRDPTPIPPPIPWRTGDGRRQSDARKPGS